MKPNPATSDKTASVTATRVAKVDRRQLSARRTHELVFFAHMEIADLADRVLAQSDLGRPHHRALYFIGSRPGVTVNELLSILRVTNQALARTLGKLMQMKLIEQRSDREDRRHRCHYLTEKGKQFDQQLSKLQLDYISRSLDGLTDRKLKVFWEALELLVGERDKTWTSGRRNTE